MFNFTENFSKIHPGEIFVISGLKNVLLFRVPKNFLKRSLCCYFNIKIFISIFRFYQKIKYLEELLFLDEILFIFK